MDRDREWSAEKLRGWKNYLDSFRLPAWEELPDFGLYMDQVIVLLGRYLDFPPAGEGAAVTASAINNYVRLRIMPAPQRKKYGRLHLAYLIMICTLKQGMGISCIQQLLPPDLSEDGMRPLYEGYVLQHRSACLSLTAHVDECVRGLLSAGSGAGDPTPALAASAAVTAGFARMLAEDLSAVPPKTGKPGKSTGESAPDSSSSGRSRSGDME